MSFIELILPTSISYGSNFSHLLENSFPGEKAFQNIVTIQT